MLITSRFIHYLCRSVTTLHTTITIKRGVSVRPSVLLLLSDLDSRSADVLHTRRAYRRGRRGELRQLSGVARGSLLTTRLAVRYPCVCPHVSWKETLKPKLLTCYFFGEVGSPEV